LTVFLQAYSLGGHNIWAPSGHFSNARLNP
jgi:hypothetical protein